MLTTEQPASASGGFRVGSFGFHIIALSLASWETSSKSLDFSDPQFSHLESGDKA